MISSSAFQISALVIYFVAMLAIGWFSYRKTNNLQDFMLADRSLKPGIAALSAGASDMSGWLLMGLPGAVYVAGLSSAWIAVGLLFGAWLNWRIVASRLRSYSEMAKNSLTIPSFFENRLKDNSRLLRIVSSFIILIFFTFYISSGMVAAGVFFKHSFNIDYLLGMSIVVVITLLYTVFGGFLGATLTDVLQGMLLFGALLAVPIVAVFNMGGISASVSNLDVGKFDLLADMSFLGIVSALAWGLGYFGQPHILVRFMALRNSKDSRKARHIGIGWMFLSMFGAVSAGMIAVGYFAADNTPNIDDPEAAFLALSQALMHPFVAGIVLAAVLAAIMSTLSSQLIVCSSALVEDLFKIFTKKVFSDKFFILMGRGGVLMISILAVFLALDPESTILHLVSFAWAGFGASFGPIILLSLFWKKLSATGALTGMVCGAATVFIWGNTSLSKSLYEIVPGFFVCLVVTIVISLFIKPANSQVIQQHKDFVKFLSV